MSVYPPPFFQRNGIVLFHGKIEELLPLPLFEPHSFDLILADPNYGETALEWDTWFSSWLSLCRPLLKASGSMWCFGSARMFRETVGDFETAGWRFVQDLIWEKQNGSGFVADRFKRVHEHVQQFVSHDAVWGDVYKCPQTETVPARPSARIRRRQGPQHAGHIKEAGYSYDGSRLQRSVIYAPNAHGYATNEVQKSTGIVMPITKYSCPPGGRILSLFTGSGTDLEVAHDLGCNAVGIEMRLEQCEAAARRLHQLLPMALVGRSVP